MGEARNGSSRGKLIAVVVAAALVIVLALVSAFGWPGWALQKQEPESGKVQPASQPTKPSIDAEPLPGDATELLKAMPESVLNFARVKAGKSEAWKDASPLEEYALSYATGKDGQDVALTVAQWSGADAAKAQYAKLTGDLGGKTLASGGVKVSGESTGSYVVVQDDDDDTSATAVWQNATVVFQATGNKNQVQRFVQKFPL